MEDLGDRRLRLDRRLSNPGRIKVGCTCKYKDCINLKQCKGMWEDDGSCPHYIKTENRKVNRRSNNNV